MKKPNPQEIQKTWTVTIAYLEEEGAGLHRTPTAIESDIKTAAHRVQSRNLL